MVQSLGQHYYIYEPTQLQNLQLVIPCHFYIKDSVIIAKCVKVFIQRTTGSHLVVLKIKAEPPFSSDQFMNIPISEFWMPYVNVRFQGEHLLPDIWGSVVWRT